MYIINITIFVVVFFGDLLLISQLFTNAVVYSTNSVRSLNCYNLFCIDIYLYEELHVKPIFDTKNI